MYHTSVMLRQCLEGLNLQSDGTYVDVTLGGGGHSRAILNALGPNARLFGFDQDADSEAHLSMEEEHAMDVHLNVDDRFTFIRSNFRYLKNWMRYYNVEVIDGLLADLGVSSHHLDDADRGFAFRLDAPLDMRMNTRAGRTAAQWIETADETEIALVLSLYGELRQARRLAQAIVRQRQQKPIVTTGDLVNTVRPIINPRAEKKELAQVFQAIRIEINHEMDALEAMLSQAINILRPGGRLVVMSYHSLEDRIVKNVIRSGRADGQVQQDFYGRVIAPLRAVNTKVITADDDEVARNPRARSAKLRIAERILTGPDRE